MLILVIFCVWVFLIKLFNYLLKVFRLWFLIIGINLWFVSFIIIFILSNEFRRFVICLIWLFFIKFLRVDMLINNFDFWCIFFIWVKMVFKLVFFLVNFVVFIIWNFWYWFVKVELIIVIFVLVILVFWCDVLIVFDSVCVKWIVMICFIFLFINFL